MLYDEWRRDEGAYTRHRNSASVVIVIITKMHYRKWCNGDNYSSNLPFILLNAGCSYNSKLYTKALLITWHCHCRYNCGRFFLFIIWQTSNLNPESCIKPERFNRGCCGILSRIASLRSEGSQVIHYNPYNELLRDINVLMNREYMRWTSVYTERCIMWWNRKLWQGNYHEARERLPEYINWIKLWMMVDLSGIS